MLTVDDLLTVALPGIAVFTLVALCVRRSPGRVLAIAALAVYSALTAGLTFFPLPTSDAYLTFLREAGAVPVVNLVPGATVVDVARTATGATMLRQLGGNLVLLLPLGAALPLLWPRFERWRSCALVIIAVSAGIEAVQGAVSLALGVPYKSFDVDDLALNVFGGVVGYNLWWVVDRTLGDSATWSEVVATVRGAVVP